MDGLNHQDLVADAIIGILTALSFGLRFYKIEEPSHVCWDEVHFGKYASYYINRTLFLDVHPPLGKIILSIAGVLSGYHGEYNFDKPGDSMEHIEYVGMRQASAIFGSLIVPLSSAIVWQLTSSHRAALIAGILVLSDTGLIVMSRYILLDSFLLCFILLACYCYVKHKNSLPFDTAWWCWLFSCGVFLACSVGVKFIGLFVVCLIGVSVINDLWNIACQKTQPVEKVIQHFLARVYTLIILPILIYCFIFVLHFIILNRSGPGDGFYSSSFQSTVIGNPLYHTEMPEYLASGSEVTLKNHRPNGGYLHSHVKIYPAEVGPAYQQVTMYQHRDDNNRWFIKKVNDDGARVEYIKSGDLVYIQHKHTKGYLYTHDYSAPLTKIHKLVSCISDNKKADNGDNIFKIRVISGEQPNGRLSPIFTTFQLIHVNQHCVIQSKDKQLPNWASKQREITCNPDTKSQYSHWNVEMLSDSRLPEVRLDWKGLRPGFLTKFIELHLVMFANNRILTPKPEDNPSRPWMWPLAYKGQLFSAEPRILMTGNPYTHWLILLLAVPMLLLFIVDSVRHQRSKAYNQDTVSQFSDTYNALRLLLIAWFLHYIPFWCMSRVLYPHHYLAAFLFSCMFTGVSLDHMATRFTIQFNGLLSEFVCHITVVLLCCLSLVSLYTFSHLIYGHEVTEDESRISALLSLLGFL